MGIKSPALGVEALALGGELVSATETETPKIEKAPEWGAFPINRGS
jgi:hypothetical protein